MIKKQLMKNSEKELFSSDELNICGFSDCYFSRDRITTWSKKISRLNVRTLAYDILIKMHNFLHILGRKYVLCLKDLMHASM